jgi:cobalt/nickel transport system permease protein
MHMANELLTPGVAAGFGAASAAGIAYSSWRVRRELDDSKVPLMGVMGAFVFAAQMVNFQILPGSSGHLGGGVLLAILLGPSAATLVMAAILIVQCLVFNDGGLLALGANIFNMGIVPCYLGYGIYRLLTGRASGKKALARGRLYFACFTATFLGMLAGAAMVPVQVAVSGVSAVPFPKFFAVMLGVHLIIAAVEGVVTFAVIAFLQKMRPALVLGDSGLSGRMSPRAVAATMGVVALVVGGFFSLVASGLPDGLEYVLGNQPPTAETQPALGKPVIDESKLSPSVQAATDLQDRIAPLPDYSKRPATPGDEPAAWWTSLSGVLGSAIVLVLMFALAAILRRHDKTPQAEQN